MRQFRLRLARQAALPEGRVALEFAEPLPAVPGQFYLALAATGQTGYLREPVFPEALAGGWVVDLPAAWASLRPGDEVDLLGPCGRGQSPAGGNVLLIAGPEGAGRVRALARAAVGAGAAATLLGERPLPLGDLPAEVEVRFGFEALPEALDWATSLYADLPAEALAEVRRGLRERGRPGRLQARAFRLPVTPCGVGACGACAVPAGRGWKLACVDGPWFDLTEIGD